MMIAAKADPNNWHIVVYPKSAGDLGGVYVSWIQHDERDAKGAQDRMVGDIRRHVDGVARVTIVHSWLCPVCNLSHETKQGGEQCCQEEGETDGA